MQVKALHPNFVLPVRSTAESGGFDLYMPESGHVSGNQPKMVGLGFAAAVPRGYVALILPRSGTGAKFGLELNNTCGVIDSDYRGEWKAMLRTKAGQPFRWEADDRLLQFVLVPVFTPRLDLTDELDETSRGTGGFGSTGN